VKIIIVPNLTQYQRTIGCDQHALKALAAILHCLMPPEVFPPNAAVTDQQGFAAADLHVIDHLRSPTE
jgi:hypothetical protein